MNGFLIIIFLLILIPVFISTMFIPFWTRKTESFGVTIPEEIYQSVELKQMRKRYMRITGISGFIVTAIFLSIGASITLDENMFSLLFSVLIFGYLISSFIIYLTFHREMKSLKKRKQWGIEKSQQVFVSIQFRSQKLNHSNLWFLISFIATIGLIALTLQSYHQIPDRIPLQYNFAGEVTNWAEKSYRSVLILPIMQLYLTLLFVFINTMIAKAKQQINADTPEESMRKNVIFRRRWSAYIIITGIALTLLFSLIQLSLIYPINQQLLIIIPLAFSIALTLGAIILSVTTGQGGSRIKNNSNASTDGAIMNRDDDAHWKLGIFYFNREDPSLFLEKRFGVGWTINLARPLAWIIFLGIIGLAVIIPYLLGA